MINILFVSSASSISGGEKVLLDIIDNIDRNKFCPIVILSGIGKISHELTERKIKFKIINNDIYYSKFWPFPFILQTILYMYMIIKENISLIHLNAFGGYLAVSIAARLTNKKVICHIHYPPTALDLKYNFRVTPDYILCCCEDMKNNISRIAKDLCLRVNVGFLTNGINIEKFSFIKEKGEIEELKRKLGFNETCFIITTIGDLSERKGQKYFIQMAKNVSEHFLNSIFIIIGKEPNNSAGYENELKELVKKLDIENKVKFLGFTDNVSEYMSISDIFVLHSFQEGLPLVILEAMACAKPVVATDVNGIPEAIQDGLTGLLLKPGDVETLIDSVSKLLSDEDLRLKIGRAARKRAEDLFDIKEYFRKIESIYLKLLNNDN